ncbi:MAG: threonylcarbamoyl-AMP synthase [Sphingobacteriales bacterium]|nr:MAG: threonylcarbamoyl-AMP synthase [Sphingobacteriales bacterium]
MVDIEADIRACVNTLAAGGIILYPTDTVWGLGCDALDEAAIDKVFALKNRPREKSMIILLAEARDILQYVAAPPPDIIETIEAFERPTTIIFDNALEFPANAVHEDGSIGIRVVNDPFCKALIKRFGRPIVSTSANLSGDPTPAFFDGISEAIREGSDYIVQWRQEDTTPRQPSRIIRIDEDGRQVIIRP